MTAWSKISHKYALLIQFHHKEVGAVCFGESNGYAVGLRTGGPEFNSKCHQRFYRVYAVYVQVKSVVPKVPLSVISNLPWMLPLEKFFPPLSETYQTWRWRWMVLPSIVKRQKSDSCHCKMGLLLRNNVSLCLKSYMGLSIPRARDNNNSNNKL